jgi:putative DNA primase/helicase
MITAFRSILNPGFVTGIHRTALTPDGAKIGRKMLGVTKDVAIMLDGDEDVAQGLCIAEGIESALAGRELGWRPCWALGSAGAIAKFPVMTGIECLNVLGENDEANRKAVQEVGTAWSSAGREVLVISPTCAGDMNDALRLRGAA